MNRVYLLLILFSTNAFCLVEPNTFNPLYLTIEDKIDTETIDYSFNFNNNKSNSIILDILNDKKSIIDKQFQVTDFFKPSVLFWLKIYTQFNSNQIVIHDTENVEIVYKIMNFDKIHYSKLNVFTAYHIQKNLSYENVKKIKKNLFKLATKSFRNLNEQDLAIIYALRKAKVKVPLNKKLRKKLFRKLAKNIRYQSGQKDMILQGINNYAPYSDFIKKQFENFKIPHELLALAFLESSFNTKASSKAGATGVWQFIKYTGNIFLPKKNKHQDYRNNIIISTIGALHLLKENKQLLKSWDLAITAYNSGTKHLIRARRKFRNKKINLEYILKNYRHKHLGFASKNYYSEFLALVYALAYKDSIYLELTKRKVSMSDYNIYLTKCSFKPFLIEKMLRENNPSFKELNPQFKNLKKKYSRGSLLVTSDDLPKNKFYLLSTKEIKLHRPHNWKRFIHNKKCR